MTEQDRISDLERRIEALEGMLRKIGSNAELNGLHWIGDEVDAVLNPTRWDWLPKGSVT